MGADISLTSYSLLNNRNRPCHSSHQWGPSIEVFPRHGTSDNDRHTGRERPGSYRYLPKVKQNLTAEGLVESRCGVQGGFVLVRSAESITILDVVNAVEPIKRICHCPLNLRSHTSLCPLHAELDHAYEVTEQAFANVTIAGLLNSTNPIIPLIDSP